MEVDQLYRRYGPMVMRRCRHLLGNEEEARDATQDVFVKLMGRKDHLTDAHPSSLLYRMATNHCLNRIRDRRSHPESSDDELLSRLAQLPDAEARIASESTLGRLFQRHPDSTRLIAVLHFVDGMTLEETAREVGMSVSGVRKRLRALRETLKEIETR